MSQDLDREDGKEGLSSCMFPHRSHQVIICRQEIGASATRKHDVSNQSWSRTAGPVVEARGQRWDFRRNKGKWEMEVVSYETLGYVEPAEEGSRCFHWLL